MKRLGVAFWTIGWGYLLLRSTIPPNSGELSGGPWLLLVACLSLAAAFGRAAEWVYVGGVIWPILYPAKSASLVMAILLLSTCLQWGIWIASSVRSRFDAAASRRSRRDAWLHDGEGDPVFTRDGAPLSRAAWRTLTPEAFEEEILALFRSHGFDGQLTSLSGDEGIDLDLWKEGRYAVAQCKHYLKPVGQPALRDFAGAMRASGADAGYFITTSRFTEAAERWASALDPPRIILVDGRALVYWAQDGRMPE